MGEKLLVATLYDQNENCERVAKVSYVSQNEYNKLVNDESKYLYNERTLKEKDNCLKKEMLERLTKLENKDFLLAKSIYDNFVDRGLINDNDKFQKDFFDFIFNNCSLDLKNTPNDFQVILRKVGNL